ncbi:hypothetical protein [Clostridium kluyveri]|nr:hypothetical protein [Clostridium kluyveri]UZQ52752.1 hypothetical protein OP486_22080 [Clostridium kluyveri]
MEPAITQWVGNIALFFVGLLLLNKKFMMRTVFWSSCITLIYILQE